MSQNKNQFEVPAIPESPRSATHDVYSEAFGAAAVHYLGAAAVEENHAVVLEGLQAQGKELEQAKEFPGHVGPLRRAIGRHRNTILTDQEAQFVTDAANIGAGPELAREAAEDLREMAEQEIDILRARFAEFTPSQQVLFEEYMSGAPSFLDRSRKQHGKDTSWTSWFATQATNEEVGAFAHWHLDSLEDEQNHPDVQEKIAHTKERYKAGVRQLIDLDVLHPNAESAINAVDDIEVYIGDIFDTLMQERGGYCKTDSQTVVLAGSSTMSGRGAEHRFGYVGALLSLEKSASHEYNHAVLGSFKQRWLNEAVTEILGRFIEGRTLDESVYQEEQQLFTAVLSDGDFQIPPRQALRAYSETGDDTTQRDAFHGAVQAAWEQYVPKGTEMSVVDLIERYIAQKSGGTQNRDSVVKSVKETTTLLAENPRELFLHAVPAPKAKELPKVRSS